MQQNFQLNLYKFLISKSIKKIYLLLKYYINIQGKS